MKKQSTFSQLAFFKLRALIGLCIALGGVFLRLLGLGAFSAKAQQNYNVTTRSVDPLVPAFFDCSKIHELGIDKQENFRAGAIMIACGLSEGGIPFRGSGFSRFVQKLMAPVSYGGLDVDLITGPETFPYVKQSWSRINCCTVKCIRPARIDDFLPKQPHATAFDLNS
jgi:hypothetical protein